MKMFKKVISYILILTIIASAFPVIAFAADEDEYRISNDYLTFMFNKKTGGFAIETAEGNPDKVLDNNIPLLYSDDTERSNGTSFITVRIGTKDYVFGQDYGFFGIDSSLGTIRVEEGNRLIEIPWTIKGITVILTAALDRNSESNTTGNVGLSFKVINNSSRNENVSVRLLLDTALGNRIDAPYFVIDTDVKPTFTETEYLGDNVPQQIRSVDSITEPSRLSYILMQADGWNGGTRPKRVIIGHWANLANTRYDYTPDPYCDFSNYSNSYREPDSAAAIYWENNSLGNGESFTGEMLYGVGNFSKTYGKTAGINITTQRVELSSDKKSYKNDGKIRVSIDIDNTAENATALSNAVFNLVVDDKQFEIIEGDSQVSYRNLGREIKTLQYTLKAVEQTDLCAGTIYASLAGIKTLSDGTQENFETAAQRSIILPSVGEVSAVQLNKINPEIVYTDGEKAVTISGKMKPLEAVLANDAAVNLKLVHETTDHTVTIAKNNIAFLDESGETLTFSTEEQLYVGKYKIVFEINDSRLKDNLKCTSITCAESLQVSADKKYQLKSYGMSALVRTTEGSKDGTYDFFNFRTETEFLNFYKGETSAKGKLNGETIKYNFGQNKDAIKNHEILLTVRANLREMKDASTGEIFWEADYSSGDIIINNMLSYEGEKPLKLYRSNNTYRVEGDGLLKVVNSINVWRSKWNISATEGIAYTLDQERLGDKLGSNVTVRSLNLSLEGAATMIQSLGGFAVDLKYGVLSSQWYDNSDGMVTYGIGFGGKISLPIKAREKKQEPDLTADQEDISEELNSLFDESLTADQEDISGDMTSMFDETPKKTVTGDRIKKDTTLSEGQLSAEVNNVLFGEKGEVKDGYVKVDDTGFIGIDAEFSLALPKDLLGSLVSNSPGIYASVKINTIKNEYEIAAGLNIKIIECEGILAFKQVNVKNKDVIVPDKIEFYIRDGLKIPVAPPVLFIAGLGGGINGLADTIGGEFDKLPPITILLFTRLEAIGVLTGDFNAKISLEGMSLTGDMKLKAKGLEKLMDLKAGINARWIEPWELALYGNASIIDGVIKGGITVTIADNYFYGYIFASICVPDSVPLVGGKELAGVEAAVSHEFIGANIKIIGIPFGVIYYWGENVSFGKNIDLSPPNRDGVQMFSTSNMDNAVGYYGTNIHELQTKAIMLATQSGTQYKEAKVNVSDANGQNALLIEVPYTGSGIPEASDITIINPKGRQIQAVYDDGNGGGNMLLQSRKDGEFIYFTITDPTLIRNGEWTIRYTTENINISSFKMNGVDEIPELDKNGTTISFSAGDNSKITAEWKINGGSGSKTGTVDVYLTKDKDVLSKIKTSKNNGDVLGTNVFHEETVVLKSGVTNKTITLPDSLANGKYYAVTTLSTTEGISLAISTQSIDFVNPNLPQKVDGIKIAYGGNGEIFVKVTDPATADYTHYLAEIVAEDGTTVLENNIGQFEKGSNFVFGKEAELEAGKSYHVNIKTLREEYKKSAEEYKKHYYYGSDIVSSNSIILPQADMPRLKSVKVNFDTAGSEINTNVKDVIIEYVFENDVFVELDLNGSKVYAFGVNPDPNNKSTYFRKEWKFVLEDLEDGDYVVDFMAYTDKKDHIQGSKTDIENAHLGFTVDTSAPVLSLAQKGVDRKMDNKDITVVFGANTVVAEQNGKYSIEGITERSANLTLDGRKIDAATDGVTIASNGSFKIEKMLDTNELFKEHLITATDKAGNVSKITVYAVRSDGFSFNNLTLCLNGNEIASDPDGVKKITLKNGQTAQLSAYVVSDNGQKFLVKNEIIDWNILYSKNAVELKDGTVAALSPGETAIKAKLATADVGTALGNRSEGIADYVIINIANNSKSDLIEKITEAKSILANNPTASESKIDALQSAIDTAEALIKNTRATEDDFTTGVSELLSAIQAFRQSDSQGSGQGSGGLQQTVKVSVSETEHGTVKISQNKVKKGNSVTITAIPDEGYTVADMLINGKSVGRDEVYTIASVETDTEVKVIFAKKSTEIPFTDIIESDWFYQSVKYSYEKGLFAGISDTKFGPYAEMTRAMLVTVLYRAEGKPAVNKSVPFADIDPDAYYAEAVIWAQQNGIVNGVTENKFLPDENIAREQIAAIIFRYARYKGYDVSMGKNTNILSYTDAENVSEYAIEAMNYAVGSGLIKGKTESTLNPFDNATRAEIATILYRFFEANK